MKHLKFVKILIIIFPALISCDRFCKIRPVEKCGELLKNGICNPIKADDYEFFLNDYELVSMSMYRNLIVDKFNFIKTYGIAKTKWHNGMEILAEHIAKRIGYINNLCVLVEEHTFSHLVISMSEVDEYDIRRFLIKGIEKLANDTQIVVAKENSIRHNNATNWRNNELLNSMSGIGCSLSAFKDDFTNQDKQNIYMHCLYTTDKPFGIYSTGESCQSCTTKDSTKFESCATVEAYICIKK